MVGWIGQSNAAAPFTVRSTFLQHGCCGLYSGIDAVFQRLLRWQLSRNFPGTTSTLSSSTIVDNSGQLSRRQKVHSIP